METGYRNNIVDFSIIQLDKDYAWDMKGPDEFDNSGFTFYVFYELFGIDLEMGGYGTGNTAKQMTNSIGILRQYIENDLNKQKYLEDIQMGDLVFFHTKAFEENQPTPSSQYPGHVGIYLGDNKFIHADEDKGKVVISDMNEFWLNKLVASRDIVSSVVLKANF